MKTSPLLYCPSAWSMEDYGQQQGQADGVKTITMNSQCSLLMSAHGPFGPVTELMCD